MVNSSPRVAPAKTPPAQQHVQGESLQSITSSLQSTACFVASCPVGNLEVSPLVPEASRTLKQQNYFKMHLLTLPLQDGSETGWLMLNLDFPMCRCCKIAETI